MVKNSDEKLYENIIQKMKETKDIDFDIYWIALKIIVSNNSHQSYATLSVVIRYIPARS